MKVTQSCLALCNPMNYTVHGILQARILKWVSCSLLQGIFPTQGSNPGLPHCRRILYQLSHIGSPRILEWVAYPISRGSSRPRNQTGSPALQADSLPAKLPCSTLSLVVSTQNTHGLQQHTPEDIDQVLIRGQRKYGPQQATVCGLFIPLSLS